MNYGLFTSEDEAEFETVRNLKGSWTSAERPSPRWATLDEIKHAEFYRFDRKTGDPPK